MKIGIDAFSPQVSSWAMPAVPRFFDPDLIISSEVVHRPTTPEQRLMIAVLGDAIECIRNTRKTRLFRDAHKWLMSNERSNLFSFLNVCEALEIDAGAVRRRLIDMG